MEEQKKLEKQRKVEELKKLDEQKKLKEQRQMEEQKKLKKQTEAREDVEQISRNTISKTLQNDYSNVSKKISTVACDCSELCLGWEKLREDWLKQTTLWR